MYAVSRAPGRYQRTNQTCSEFHHLRTEVTTKCHMQGRNRRCITVDMRQEEGRQIIKQLANKVDVLVENFRPGVMEKWNLGPKVKPQIKPDPVYQHCTGC
jgi:crotonobetainyl-CoA:carnitine CoA-transferase CaiB-like acyl-CoA transferase